MKVCTILSDTLNNNIEYYYINHEFTQHNVQIYFILSKDKQYPTIKYF